MLNPKNGLHGKLIAGCLVAGSVWSSTPARAQAMASVGLEEVVVTARKRTEPLQSVPIAVSSMDSRAIENMGFDNVGDLAEKVPMLSMAPFPNTSSAMVVFMRGVGTIDSEQIARDAGVGIYLDDIYLGRAQGLTTDLIDIERIEVLRGPQGTLYGRNTIGGAIKFVTAKPTGEWGFNQSLSFGNRDYRRSLTTLNLPRYADFSAALSYLDSGQDGTVKNPGDGPDFDQKNKRGYRVALRWQPVTEFTADYAYDNSLQHGTSMYEQRGGPGFFSFSPVPISPHRLGTAIRPVTLPIEDNFTTRGHALTLAWDVSDALTLKSITSYRKLDSNSLHDTVEAFGIPAAFIGDTGQNQFSQELLLNGSDDDLRLKYIVGAFYFRERANQATSSLANPFFMVGPPTLADFAAEPEAHVENSSEAVYGQVTWTPPVLDNRLSLSAGARESRDKREIERIANGAPLDSDEKSFSSFDPSVTMDYGWSDDVHTYLSYSEGYRTGGFNLRAPANSPPFDPEELTTYEIGIKSSWAQKVRANLALYHSRYRDIQLDFIDPLTNLVSTVNGSRATIEGAELEIAVMPIERLEINVDYAYMEARKKGGTITDPFTQLPLEGTSLPFTPHNKYNIGAAYTLPPSAFGALSARIGYSWNGEQTSNGGPNTEKDPRPSFGLLDARIALQEIPLDRYGSLTIGVWGKNLENKEYVIYRLYGADIYGEPRSYGVDINYKL